MAKSKKKDKKKDKGSKAKKIKSLLRKTNAMDSWVKHGKTLDSGLGSVAKKMMSENDDAFLEAVSTLCSAIVDDVKGIDDAVVRCALAACASDYTLKSLITKSEEVKTLVAVIKLSKSDLAIVEAVARTSGKKASESLAETMLEGKKLAKKLGIKSRAKNKPKDTEVIVDDDDDDEDEEEDVEEENEEEEDDDEDEEEDE